MLMKLSSNPNSDDFVNSPRRSACNFPGPSGEVTAAEVEAHTR
jgi:hypothetical protein